MIPGHESPRPITEVSLPALGPGLADALRPILAAHGASIQEQGGRCVVRFPEGTTMQRKLPVVLTTRYDVRLPDGYLLLYLVGHDGKTDLCFDPCDLSPEVQALFPQGGNHETRRGIPGHPHDRD